MNHVDKYYWVIDYEGIGYKDAQGSIELTPQLVNPINGVIEEDVSLNTKFVWWGEFNKLDNKNDEYPTHYWDLDCSGDSAEEAIDNLYELVLANYPNTKQRQEEKT